MNILQRWFFGGRHLPKVWRGVGKGLFGAVLLLYFLGGLAGPSPAETVFCVTQSGAGDKDGSNWDNAFGEAAFIAKLKTAADGDVFWIARGVYRPVIPADSSSITDPEKAASFVLKSGVKLYGGFGGTETNLAGRDWQNHPTVLTGDLAGDDTHDAHGATVDAGDIAGDNSNTVVYADGTVGATALLDGCIICGGSKGTCFKIGGADCFCGGGLCVDGGSPVVTHCTFCGNHADVYGGGMLNRGGSPTVTSCTFSGNSAGSWGGGMRNDGSLEVSNCTFCGNHADVYGGGMLNCGYSTVTNCTFFGNSANRGGGMLNWGGSSTLTNCTFSGNSATEGGGMYNYANLTVVNCIFWNNTGEEICNSNVATVTYSVVKGGYGGVPNIITDDPLLEPLQDNGGPTQTCALGAGSFALDAGLAVGTHDIVGTSVTVPDDDQRGMDREGAPDIGAYEYRSDRKILTVNVEGSGTVDRSPEGTLLPTGSRSWYYAANTAVTLTAQAGASWGFDCWSGGASGTASPVTVLMDSDNTVTATFLQHTIAASAGTGGTIDPVGNVTVPHGGNQSFTITPAGGYKAEDVVVDGASQGALANYTFINVTGDHTIAASFAAVPTSAPAPKPDPDPTSAPAPTATPVPTITPVPSPTEAPTSSPVPTATTAPFPTPDPDIPLPEATLRITLTEGGEILSGPLEISLTPELRESLLLEKWLSPEEFDRLFAQGYNSEIVSLFSFAAKLEEGVSSLSLSLEITLGDTAGSVYQTYVLGATWDSSGNPLGFVLLEANPEGGRASVRASSETRKVTLEDNGSMDNDPREGYVDAEIAGVLVTSPQEITPGAPSGSSGGGCLLGAAPALLLLALPLLLLSR